MRICRFDDDRLGVVRDGLVHDVTPALQALPAVRWPLPHFDPLVANLQRLRPALERQALGASGVALDSCVLRSPVAWPGKVVAARRNYGKAVGTPPDLFLKATSSVVGPGDGIELPAGDRQCQWEIELAAVIGRSCRNVSASDALAHLAGYCVALDLSVAGNEDRGLRKSLDTFCVLGPWLTTADAVDDPQDLRLEATCDREAPRQGHTGHMIHPVAALVAAASAWFTLHPGDVLLTGSPLERGTLAAGATLDCRVEGLGSMRVPAGRTAERWSTTCPGS